MRSFFLYLFIASLAFGANALPTATTEHAKVSIVSEAQAITPGEPFDIAIDFELEDHWHIYWKNPGDSGLAPMIDWNLPNGFAAGSIRWPLPKSISIEGLTNYGYEGTPSLIQKIIPPTGLEGQAFSIEGNEVILKAHLEWLICKEVCIPESADVSLTLPISTKSLRDEAAFDSRRAALAAELELPAYYETKKDAIYLQLPIQVADDAYFFPEIGGIISHSSPQTIIQTGNYSILKLTKDAQAPEGDISGVLVDAGKGYSLNAQPTIVAVPQTIELQEAEQSNLSLGLALLFALLGGLLLNIMPCVFPVLSLKALSMVKKADSHQREIRKQGLAYFAGVIVSFLVLGGLMLALKATGQSLGWGFQLQSPVFVMGMMFVFFLLGLSLIGLFHLPVIMGTTAQLAEQKESTKGSFLTGVLAVLVATPCAVPFMAPAVGYAFSQSAIITLAIMVALGVGLALPYVLLAFIPALQKRMPKPGVWMNRFKEFMAFPMFASAAWLLWVLNQQVSVEDSGLALFALILVSFFIWLNKRWANWVGYLIIILSMLVIYNGHQMALAGEKTQALKSISEPFTPERLAQLRAEGKPVFVNATAAWCITCKVNERVALQDADLTQAFKDQNITYLLADWTNYDDTITQWLENYQRSGVPLYVYYPAQGEQPVILPQLLTTSIVFESIMENPKNE